MSVQKKTMIGSRSTSKKGAPARQATIGDSKTLTAHALGTRPALKAGAAAVRPMKAKRYIY